MAQVYWRGGGAIPSVEIGKIYVSLPLLAQILTEMYCLINPLLPKKNHIFNFVNEHFKQKAV